MTTFKKLILVQWAFAALGVLLFFALRIPAGHIHFAVTVPALKISGLWLIPLLTLGLGFSSRAAMRWAFIRDIYDKIMASVLGRLIEAAPAWQLLVISLLAGGGEEWTFRGVLQTRFGIVLASFIFGLLHFVTPLYFFIAAAIGAYLGWVYEIGGHNLFPPVVLHTVYDFMVLMLLRKSLRRTGAGNDVKNPIET